MSPPRLTIHREPGRREAIALVLAALFAGCSALAQPTATAPRDLIARGIALASSGNHAAAAQVFRRAVQAAPADHAARYNLALALYNAGDLPAAKAQFLQVCEAVPEDPQCLRGLGLTQLALHEYRAATRTLSQAARLMPADAPTLSALGRAYLAIKEPRKALDALRTAHRLKSGEAGIAYDLGRAAAAAGDNPEAIRAFGRALVLKPDSVSAALGLATAYQASGRNALAVEALAPFADSESAGADVFRALAKSYEALGLEREATVARERLTELLPPAQAAAIHKQTGKYYMDLMQWPEAVSHLLKAAEAAPGDVETHIALAKCYHSMGSLDEELVRWQQAANLAPKDTSISLGLASALASGDKRKAALDVLRKALGVVPESRDLLRLAAETARELGLAEETESYLRRVLALNPRDWPARRDVVDSLLARGQQVKALVEAGEGLRAPKPPVDAFQTTASIAEQVGNLEFAADCWRRLGDAHAQQRAGAAINRARVLTTLQRPAEAVAVCREALDGAAGHIGLALALARAHQSCGDDRAAIEALSEVLGRHPELVHARVMLAESLSWLGEHDRAREEIRRVMRAGALDRAGCEALSLVSARAGRHRDATATFLVMLPDSPLRPRLLELLVGLYEGADAPEEGGERLSALFEAHPGHPDIGLAAGELLAAGGKVAEADKLLRRLVRDPQVGQDALRRLVALHVNWGHPERAIEPLRNLLERDLRAAWVIAMLAEIEQRPLLAAQAVGILSALADAPQGSPAFWLAAADLTQFMQRVPDAHARMAALAAAEPADPGLQVGAAALALADGKPTAAVQAIGRIPDEQRFNRATLLTLARAQTALGDDAAASNTLRMSLGAGLGGATEKVLYAGIEQRARRLESALLLVSQALVLDPLNAEAKTLLQALIDEGSLVPAVVLDALADIYRVRPDAEVLADAVASLRGHPGAGEACDRWLQMCPRREAPAGAHALPPVGTGLAPEVEEGGDVL